jgi:acylphosphatase
MLTVEVREGLVNNVIQQHARELDLEGIVQPVEKDKIKIVVCGKKDDVDSFVDVLHKESTQIPITDIEIEPHIKDRDYRGVFRIIE